MHAQDLHSEAVVAESEIALLTTPMPQPATSIASQELSATSVIV